MSKEIVVPANLQDLIPSLEEGRQSVLKIRVDQTPVILPQYASHLNLYEFWNHLQNTFSAVSQIKECGDWTIQLGGDNLDRKIMNHLVKDPKFGDYLIALLRHGPQNPDQGYFCDGSYCYCASMVSDWMRKRNTFLEIVPHRRYKGWGIFLKEGTIIVRGDVESVSGIDKAGLVYVDGQASLIDSPALMGAGIVYVKGKISKLYDPSYMTVIAPAGIDEYEMPRHHASGKLKPTPPFIFTGKVISGTKLGFEERTRSGTLFVSGNRKEKFFGCNVLPGKVLTGWSPEETRQKAEALVRQRLNTELERRLRSAKTLPKLAEIAEMFFEPPEEDDDNFGDED